MSQRREHVDEVLVQFIAAPGRGRRCVGEPQPLGERVGSCSSGSHPSSVSRRG